MRESEKGNAPWNQVTSLLKNQSFKRYALYPMPPALCFMIPNSTFPFPNSNNSKSNSRN
jgi:hypothetical protein